jgi:tRNA nucleotidyltransferase (CCA-adding enzyme)
MNKNSTSAYKSLGKKLKSIHAKDIMTRKVLTVPQDLSLAEVAEKMVEQRVSGFPVTGKKGKVVGIITETDLFLVMDMIKSGDVIPNGEQTAGGPSVRFAMSSEVIRAKPDTTLEEIVRIMKYKNVYTLPVFQGARMVGIIGRRDVFHHFYRCLKRRSK